MPSVIINEKDLSVYNAYLNNDNIVWIPGFSITGPYDTPRLLNSHADLVATFGDRPPAETYSSAAVADAYKLCTGYDFAAQMLTKGFRVLFQRIVPYFYEDGDITAQVDFDKLRTANLNIQATTPVTENYIENTGEYSSGTTYYTKDGDTYIQYSGYFITSDDAPVEGKTYYTYDDSAYVPHTDLTEFSQGTDYYEQGFEPGVVYYYKETVGGTTYTFGFKEKYGGTFGNRISVIFTVNTVGTKLFLKVIDVKTLEILEYKEISTIKYSNNNQIDPSYILTFARDLTEAVGSSAYIELDDTETGISSVRLLDVDGINDYILKTLSSTTGTFEKDLETGTIVYTRNPEAVGDDNITIADYNLFDHVLINADQTSSVLKVRSTSVLGVDTITTGAGNKITTGISAELGKDFTINDAYDTTSDENALYILADVIARDLDNISDKILYDVKYITLGNLHTVNLTTSSNFGTTTFGLLNEVPLVNIAANLCAFRGDCVAIFHPSFRSVSGAEEAQALYSMIGGKASSYSAVFAPWAVMSIYNTTKVWCSPAMVFLTALADSVANGNPVYLPPAGVNRAVVGDIVKTEYMIGSALLDDWQNKDRPANINPIMFLNTYGYTIFGQRTLYDVSDELVGTRSALQELGVRLTVLECKKEIRRVAIGLIFEYNNLHTWNEFKEQLRPMFDEMLANGAITKYQIIMDDTTNSPDDIDDNTLRGVVKIIPGRAVEDVVISFEIYRSGVTFEDEEAYN